VFCLNSIWSATAKNGGFPELTEDIKTDVVIVGGGLAGVVGMLLGVPLAATAYRIIRDDVRKNEIRNTSEES